MSREKSEVQYSSLPEEILTHIFLYLPIEALLALSLVNQETKRLAKGNVLWKMINAHYFPNFVNSLTSQSDTNWYEKFRDTYVDEIKLWPTENLQKIAKTIIREDTENLEKMDPSLKILDNMNLKGTSLWDLAKKIGNQSVLDYLYQRIKNTYISPQGELLKEADLRGRTLFYWLIVCNQGADEFASLNRIAPIANQLDKPCSTRVPDKPIHLAGKEGRLELVKAILTAKPDLLESTGAYGLTALSWACANGHAKVVEYLISRGANVNQSTHCLGNERFIGMTPLHWAAKGGHVEVVKLLLEHGALVSVENIKKEQPLHHAVESGSVDVVKLIFYRERANLHATTAEGLQPLHYAAITGKVEIIMLLLEEGANIKAETLDHSQPLLLAMVYNRVEAARKLIEMGAELEDVLFVENNRQAILYEFPESTGKLTNRIWAVHHLERVGELLNLINLITVLGYLDILKLILEKKRNLLEPSIDINKIILLAAKVGHEHIAIYLLGLFPKLDAEIKNKLLFIAADRKHITLVELLLKAGADPSTKDTDGDNIIHSIAYIYPPCYFSEYLKIIDLLLEKNPKLLNDVDNYNQTPLHYAAKNQNEELVAYLLEKQAELDCIGQEKGEFNGFTALHWAADAGSVRIVSLLINAKANCNIQTTNDAYLPIHLAAKLGHILVVKTLMEADPLALVKKDKKGHTPLFYLAKYYQINNDEDEGDDILDELIRNHISQLKSKEEIGLFLYDFFSAYYSFLLKRNLPLSNQLASCFKLVGDINLIKNENGDTLLHHLAKEWRSINRSADVNAPRFVKLFILPLMVRGANPQVVNNNGYTAPDITDSLLVPLMFKHAENRIQFAYGADKKHIKREKRKLLEAEINELRQENKNLHNQSIRLQDELQQSYCGKRKSPERSSEQVKDEIKQAKKARVSDAVVSPLENFGLFQSDIRKDENEESQEKVREEKNDENGFKKN